MSQSPGPANPSEVAVSFTPPKTLAELEQASWQQLLESTKPKANPSTNRDTNLLTVATCTNQGADARTVVLRRVNVTHKYVWFHTDARAEKVLQLEAFPVATLLFWDDTSQIQLRLSVETRLHTDDYIADDHWKNLSLSSRKAYLSELVPGSELDQPYPGFPDELVNRLPTEAESKAGRKNFATIECRVLSMDYLHLNRQGQLRALFQYEPESRMVWLAP